MPRVLVATSGRKQKSTVRVDVRLLAYKGGAVETAVESYDGLRFLDRAVVFAGSGAVQAGFAFRLFNETVEKLKREGFRGLKRIDAEPHRALEAFMYVSATGDQPRLDVNYELQPPVSEAASELAALDRKNAS